MAAPSRVLVVGGGVIGTLRWECCAVNAVRIVRCLRTLTFGVLPMVCGFAFLPSSWLWCDVVVRVSEMTSRSGTKRPSPPVVPTKLSPNLLWNCILILVYSIPSCVHKLYWILMMGVEINNKGLRTAVELARRHIPVVVRAPVHPVRDTQTNCSQGAAGIWGLGGPIYCADPRLKQWSMEVRTILIWE